jgi:NAD(P)-dependent dehydrogenase (short-subunit alcohol dehydrogenase family)
MARALLVTGATGKQGGSLINALLEANADFEILALTRNANSASAQKLKAKSPNIKLVTGDLDAIDSVFEKAKQASKLPIWGVFSVQVGVLVHVFTAFPNEFSQGSNRQWSECGKRREARQGPGRCGHQEQC